MSKQIINQNAEIQKLFFTRKQAGYAVKSACFILKKNNRLNLQIFH